MSLPKTYAKYEVKVTITSPGGEYYATVKGTMPRERIDANPVLSAVLTALHASIPDENEPSEFMPELLPKWESDT